MQLPYYQVDAFVTEVPFSGNPAGVCPLDHWLDESVLQGIALENQLSETAFLVKCDGEFQLRWFTPESEVDLCGHATLASAHVLFSELGRSQPKVSFQSRSGELGAWNQGNGQIQLDFPARSLSPVSDPSVFEPAIGVKVQEAFRAIDDVLLIVEDEQAVCNLQPDFMAIGQLEARGLIVSAEGSQTDFVSRFFAPGVGVNEDPATGSAHCTLAPFWAKRLGKNELEGTQLSARRGRILCQVAEGRVMLTGQCRTFLTGFIHL